MDISELKAEANALGYSIVKKITYEKVSKCHCSHSSRVYYGTNGREKYYYCNKCGYKGEPAKTKYQAIINWNRATSDIKRHSDHMEKRTQEFIKIYGGI